MISYEEALRLVLSRAVRLPEESVPLHQARDRVLAEDVVSPIAVPRFSCSAMDGFAVVSGGRGPRVVRRKIVAGDSPLPEPVTVDEAVAIMTGAPVPDGADAVVKIEDTQRDGDRITFGTVTPGAFIRPAGGDFAAGSVVASRGTRLTPELLMAIGAVGVGAVAVARRPRVAIVPTGRELVAPGEPLRGAGDIYSSSAVYLQTSIHGAVVMDTVRDDPAEFRRVIDRVGDYDVILTTGAVSMGEHDFIPSTLKDMGAEIVFHKMATRPAKPTLFAMLGTTAIFGLPGNPISTAVGHRFLVWPYLARCLGLPDERGRPLAANVKRGDLKCFYKCRLDGDALTILPGQDSHLIRPLTEANAWAATTTVDGMVDVYSISV